MKKGLIVIMMLLLIILILLFIFFLGKNKKFINLNELGYSSISLDNSGLVNNIQIDDIILSGVQFIEENNKYKIFFNIAYADGREPFAIRVALVSKSNELNEHVMEVDTTRPSPIYFKYEIANKEYKQIGMRIEKKIE